MSSGPISTAATLVEPTALLKAYTGTPDDAHRLLSQSTNFLLAYAIALCEAGATVITVGDPTGEILVEPVRRVHRAIREQAGDRDQGHRDTGRWCTSSAAT